MTWISLRARLATGPMNGARTPNNKGKETRCLQLVGTFTPTQPGSTSRWPRSSRGQL